MNELLKRNVYPDGVYYFALKQIRTLNYTQSTTKDLMKLQLGDSFFQDPESFFFGKKMLIIFDDFELISKTQEVCNPTYLLRAMNDNEIHTLMISREAIVQPKELHQFDRFELKRLNSQESLMVLLASQNRLFIKFSKFKEETLLNCSTIQRSQGNPKKLYMLRLHFIKEDLDAKFVEEN